MITPCIPPFSENLTLGIYLFMLKALTLKGQCFTELNQRSIVHTSYQGLLHLTLLFQCMLLVFFENNSSQSNSDSAAI